MAFPLAVELSPAALVVAPGGSAELSVTITNLSSVVEQYQVDVVGLPGGEPWSYDRSLTTLRPRESGTVHAVLSLPVKSAALAGTYVLAVLVSSPSEATVSRAAELQLEITAVSGLTITADPILAYGTKRARFEVRVHNDGNTKVLMQLIASDGQGKTQITMTPGQHLLPPRTSQITRLDVVAPRLLSGPERRLQISICAEAQSETQGVVQVVFVQKPRMGPALTRVLAVLLAVGALAGATVAGSLLAQRKPNLETSPGSANGGGQSSEFDTTGNATGSDDKATPHSIADCPPSRLTAEHKLQPDTVRVLSCVHHDFPKIEIFYGWRPDDLPDHPSGRALDIMIPNFAQQVGLQYGNKIVLYLQANATSLGIDYVIWRQHIWNVHRQAEGWRLMPGRGGLTANHMDHVHVTTLGHGAGGTTITVPTGEGSPPVAPMPSPGETADTGAPTMEATPSLEPSPSNTPTSTPEMTPTPDLTPTAESPLTPSVTPSPSALTPTPTPS